MMSSQENMILILVLILEKCDISATLSENVSLQILSILKKILDNEVQK